MDERLLRRFRKEIRTYPDIVRGATVTLTADPKRDALVRAATLLLDAVFDGHITVIRLPDGMLCACREEAGMYHLQEYTRRQAPPTRILLSSLTKKEIETLLKQETGQEHEVYMEESSESEFISRLAQDFSDIRYGL